MHLNKIAQKNMHEKFEVWDRETQTFSRRGFEGRVHLMDRFLSIYNRPLRKRQLFVKPGTRLPESRVFRHPKSGCVYLIGQGRQDAASNVDSGDTYVSMYMCHEVTPEPGSSSGLASYFRRGPKGPLTDPGWLVEEELEPVFIDMEFRTSSTDTAAYDHKIESLFCWAPLWLEAKAWDFIELWGERYRVVDTYVEAGLRGLRIDREKDVRVDFTIQRNQQVFDPVGRKWTDNIEEFNVTGVIVDTSDLANWRGVFREDIPSSNAVVAVNYDHIGFTPEVGMRLNLGGRVREIKEVHAQAGDKQYKMVVE